MRALTRWIAYFFAAGPYRFLILLVVAAVVTGIGLYHQTHLASPSARPFWPLAIAFVVYSIGSVCYAYLIYRGTWKTSFWDPILRAVDQY